MYPTQSILRRALVAAVVFSCLAVTAYTSARPPAAPPGEVVVGPLTVMGIVPARSGPAAPPAEVVVDTAPPSGPGDARVPTSLDDASDEAPTAAIDTPTESTAERPAPTADPLVGRFALVPSASEDLEEAVARATESLSRRVRSTARERLLPAMTPPPTYEIVADGPACVLTSRGGQSLRLVPGGPALQQGGEGQITATRQGASLVVRTQSEQGSRTQTITPTADGVRIETVFEAGRLDAPVRLTSVYRRTS